MAVDRLFTLGHLVDLKSFGSDRVFGSSENVITSLKFFSFRQ